MLFRGIESGKQTKVVKHKAGFTLIEVVLSLGLLALLSSSVFVIMSSLTTVTQRLSESQQKSVKNDDFESYLRYIFANLKEDSSILLESTDVQETQQLTIIEPNVYFLLRGEDIVAEELKIIPKFNKNGLINAEVEFLTQDVNRVDQVVILPILNDVDTFRWLFYDSRLGEWVDEWKSKSTKPIIIKLIYKTIREESYKSLVIAI